jgi:protein-tyrosine phosphatase
MSKVRLAHLKVTHILSVVFIPPAVNLIPKHIKHLFLKADDKVTFNMTDYFEQACQFINDARRTNGVVLVHCLCGISRSSTICCAYLMKHHSMTVEQALVQLRSHRRIIRPNNGFLRQLIAYDEQLEMTRSDRNRSTIEYHQ